MNEDFMAIEAAAKRACYANYKVLPNGNHPPVWENTSEEVREWVRRQVRSIFSGQDLSGRAQ